MTKQLRLFVNILMALLTLDVMSPVMAENARNNEVSYRLSHLLTPVDGLEPLDPAQNNLQWEVSKDQSANLQHANGNSWIRIDIDNTGQHTADRLLELATTDIHSVDIFELDTRGTPGSALALYPSLGLDKPFRDRPINYRNIVYPLTVEAQSSRSFLLHIRHNYATKLNTYLWNKKQFYEYTTMELLFFGMIYGALTMIAMYNLFIYVSIREKSHLFFVLFSSFTGLFIAMMEGHLAQFVANETAWPKQIIFALIMAMMCFFFALFSIHFLDIERWSVWLMRLMLACASLASLALVFIGLMPHTLIFSQYALLFIIALYGIGIGIGLYVWHRGISLAGFYTLAIFLCNIGLMSEYVSHMPFFPSSIINYSYASQGNVAMILVFAFAIAYKMRLLQKEKLSASLKLVKLTEDKAQNSVDIYKAKLHEVELAREASEAKIESRARSEFLATMSHEIRTPMNGVLGMTELLGYTELDNKQRQYATSISNSAKALLNAINDLLDYTKIESGKMEFDYRLFNLEKIIDDCISIFGLRAAESRICFTGLILPGTPVQLKGDPEKVRQILLNLLGNAFNLTNKNDISLRAYPTGKSTINSIEIRFDITTHDIMLSEEDKNTLFSPLQENEQPQTKHSGHELGLTVSRQLAEFMQGSMGVDTSANNTTLWFTARFILPHSNEEKNLGDRSKALNGRRIFICDTHPAFTESVRLLAESWGMQSATANNTQDLINKLLTDSNAYQILLIARELLTPEVQLAVRQCNVNHNFSTAIILATHSSYSIEADELKKQGIHCVLETPYTTTQLYQSLLKAMGVDSENIAITAPKELAVLVAEDNNVNMMVIDGLLKKLKIYPHTASDGQQALNAFCNSSTPFNLVFMDCEMPEMDGYEATAAIREYEQQHNQEPCIIIGLSAHSNNEYKEQALKSGMNDFLVKPVNTEDIENILERIESGFFKVPEQSGQYQT